ncbi:MAG: pyruvate kinase, partial [Planctomycetes bacterium]|nr:pyruvate kinase [Planctomycetota bacterium]
MANLIKTKIVATVGPASSDVPILTRLVKAGVDVFRINFSHGTIEEHEQRLASIREVSSRLGVPLGVIADLCGPKIRVGKITGGGVLLSEGSELIIQRKPIEGTVERISTTLGELIDDVRDGQRILIDDGKLQLKVLRRRPPNEILCRVVTGGVLAGGKGVNLPQTNLCLPPLTEKDLSDTAWIATRDFDYVALSFVRRSADVKALRKILTAGGSKAKIIAKIEKPQAMKNIDAIIDAADAVLVARGDLGVETALSEVPIVQKRLIGLCSKAGKSCIVATQMLETMTTNAAPTRAEVSDVANAVFDGADAIMLSGETAVGKYPVKAVEMMNEIARHVEQHLLHAANPRRFGDTGELEGLIGPTAAIARAVHKLSTHAAVRDVVAYT